MKIAPFIDPDGIACDRERAAYRAELITERDRFLIAFLPVAEDGLTCLGVETKARRANELEKRPISNVGFD